MVQPFSGRLCRQPSFGSHLSLIHISDLAETPLNYLVNTKADNWLDDIAAASACYGEIQKGLGDVPIRSHAYEGPCSVVTYENGVVLIANHTGVDADCRGRTIPAGQILRVDP